MRLRNIGIQGVHQLEDRFHFLGVEIVRLQRLQGAAPDDGNVVPGKIVFAQQLPQLQLHQLDEFRVVHQVDLVQEDHDEGHAHLPGQQDVLPGLGHGAVVGAHHQNRPVHLGRPGDHVLDIVGVTRAVHVGVVPLGGLVLHVGQGNGDAPLFFFRRLVDLVKGNVGRPSLLGQMLGDGRGQGRLAMIDMTNRPYIHVRLLALKLLLGHEDFLLIILDHARAWRRPKISSAKEAETGS